MWRRLPCRLLAVQIKWLYPDARTQVTLAYVGDSLQKTAERCNVELECACGGGMSCATCHVILPTKVYAALPEPKLEELEMLESQDDYTDTSRLGCQVKVTAEMQGLEVKVAQSCWSRPVFQPAQTRDKDAGLQQLKPLA
jgi:ferredoxin